MKLRPHHILDIIRDHGRGRQYTPHPYGHAQHLVAAKLLADLNMEIQLILGADAICQGCCHLLPDGQCKDVLPQLNPSPSKQAYNDVLDCRLFDAFSLKIDQSIILRDYLEIANKQIPGLEMICTHPKEDRNQRLSSLIQGLTLLGIR